MPSFGELIQGVAAPVCRRLSPDEVRDELDRLFRDQVAMAKVGKFARWNARKTRFGEDAFGDLVGEAAKRLLDPKTVWLSGRSAYDMLAGAIRSIAWNWKEPWKRKKDISNNEPKLKLEIVSLDDSDSIVSSILTPEEDLLAAEEYQSALKVCEDLFKDDDVALRMAVLMLSGVDGKELKKAINLGDTDYETKRRLIRRRLARHVEDQGRS